MGAQLALYEPVPPRTTGGTSERTNQPAVPGRVVQRAGGRGKLEAHASLCAACHAREARYGFQPDANDPLVERPRTWCFECFRVEMGRRQDAARAVQVRLPLEQTLDALSRRRRRAQIVARRALGAR